MTIHCRDGAIDAGFSTRNDRGAAAVNDYARLDAVAGPYH